MSKWSIVMVCLVLGSVACDGCDTNYEPVPYPAPEQYNPGYGQPCRQGRCRPGLQCTQDNMCDYLSCSYASDPDQYCATKLNLAPQDVFCGGTSCQLIQDPTGLDCESQDTCGPFGVCLDGKCRRACSFGSGCLEGEVCDRGACLGVEVPEGCTNAPDPLDFCAQALGLTRNIVRCVNNVCEGERRGIGEVCREDSECAQSVCDGQICTPTCQSDMDCASNEFCDLRPGNLPGKLCNARACGNEPFPNIACSIDEGTPLGVSLCKNDRCRTLLPQTYPLLLIKDNSDPSACQSPTPQSTLLSWVGLQNLDTQSILSTRFDLVQADVRHQGNFSNPFALSRQMNWADAQRYCGDTSIQSQAQFSQTLTRLGCGGAMVVRLLNPARTQAESLRAAAWQLIVGRYRDYCQIWQYRVAFDDMRVYRCAEDLFDVGEEQACEELIGVEDSMTGLTYYDLAPIQAP